MFTCARPVELHHFRFSATHVHARAHAKADRKTGILAVKGFWYEKEFKPTKKFKTQFNKKLNEFATFCGCQSVNIKDL